MTRRSGSTACSLNPGYQENAAANDDKQHGGQQRANVAEQPVRLDNALAFLRGREHRNESCRKRPFTKETTEKVGYSKSNIKCGLRKRSAEHKRHQDFPDQAQYAAETRAQAHNRS